MFYLHNIQKLFVIGFVFSSISCSPTIKALDKQFNWVKVEPPLFCTKENPCQEAEEFHKTLLISDLHAGSLLLGRDLIESSEIGLVDLPRLMQGNVAVQVFGVVTKYSVQDINSSGSFFPNFPSKNNEECDNDLITWRARFSAWPVDTEKSLLARSLHQAAMLHVFEIRSEILSENNSTFKRFRIIKSQRDLDEFTKARESNPELTAGLLGLEGAHGLQGNLGCKDADDGVLHNLEILFNAGFRMIG